MNESFETILKSIQKLDVIKSLSKHEKIVQGILGVIDSGHLPIGAQLPSINKMVEEIGFARKTFVKAYEDLKDRGLVESQKTKGYFVVSNDTQVVQRIALLLYAFQRFQQEFYDSLREEFGDKVHIDVYFHHNNIKLFDTIFQNIHGKYGVYVIAPIICDKARELMASLPQEKLIIVDRYLNTGSRCSYVTQEFYKSTLKALNFKRDKISSYTKIVLFYNNFTDYPEGILRAYKAFLGEFNLHGIICNKYQSKLLDTKTLYICISDSDLWPLLKDIEKENLIMGKEIGVISFNDHIVKEIITGGVTTVSTNFKEMGKKVAKLIQYPDVCNQIIPTELIDRGSF